MSYSFHLNNISSLTMSSLTAQPGLGDLQFVDGYPIPQNDRWPMGFTYIFQDQVTARSVEVEYDGDHFQVMVFAASSPEDYALAINLVTAVAKVANVSIFPEDLGGLNAAEFGQQYNADWATEQSCGVLKRIFDMFGNSLEKGHQVSGVTGLMTLGPNIYQQMTATADNMADAFFYRLKKLNYINDEDVFQSPLLVVHDEATQSNMRVAEYGEAVETLLYDKNTLVELATGESSALHVGLQTLAQLLGDSAKWLSEELLLVPALKGDQWQDLLKRAEAVAVTDLTPFHYDPQNDPFKSDSQAIKPKQSELTAVEVDKLVYAPMAVFCLVASADLKIDSKEINAFQRELITGITTNNESLQAVLLEAVAEFKPRISYLLGDDVDIKQTLSEIIQLLDSRIPTKDALDFKLSLLRMGTKVAEASGGFLGVFGDKVCKAEKQMLADLTVMFGVVEG